MISQKLWTNWAEQDILEWEKIMAELRQNDPNIYSEMGQDFREIHHNFKEKHKFMRDKYRKKNNREKARDKINEARIWMDECWDNLDHETQKKALARYEKLINDYREKYDSDL